MIFWKLILFASGLFVADYVSRVIIVNRQALDEAPSDSGSSSSSKLSSKCARVAVYEHVPIGDAKTQSPHEVIAANLRSFFKAIQIAASEQVRLIVFPEDSLLNAEQYPRSMLIEQVFEEMPNPGSGGTEINPCFDRSIQIADNAAAAAAAADMKNSTTTSRFSVLREISCLARHFRMFIALCHGDKVPCDPATDRGCPPDRHFLFNTIALFDWNGNLVAKYHKMQLYYEQYYNIPADSFRHRNPIVHYDSPFGRLGFLICYDLLFRSPAIELIENRRITTLIYATYWFNYLPFVAGVQMQQAFAIEHQINFLASGAHDPKNGTYGCGIFSGERGALVYNNLPDERSKLMIATIPCNVGRTKLRQGGSNNNTRVMKKSRKRNRCPVDAKTVMIDDDDDRGRSSSSSSSALPLGNTHLNASIVRLIPLRAEQDFVGHCCPYTGFCCHLHYRVRDTAKFSRENFVLLFANATSGALGQERYPISQEFCGMAACVDKRCSKFAINSATRFSLIILSGKFRSKYIYPGVLTDSLGLLPADQWRYRSSIGERSITIIGSPEPLVAVTLYGRLYEQDPPYKQ